MTSTREGVTDRQWQLDFTVEAPAGEIGSYEVADLVVAEFSGYLLLCLPEGPEGHDGPILPDDVCDKLRMSLILDDVDFLSGVPVLKRRETPGAPSIKKSAKITVENKSDKKVTCLFCYFGKGVHRPPAAT